MHFYKDYLQNLSGDTVDQIGKDMDVFADYVADSMDKIWNDMVAKNETMRTGQRHTIERVQISGGDFERVLRFHYRGGTRSRVSVIVARGIDSSGRETVAWAEDRLEKRKLQNTLKLFQQAPNRVFEDIDGYNASCIAAVQVDKYRKGEWFLLTAPFQYDFRANHVKWAMDYELPDFEENTNAPKS